MKTTSPSQRAKVRLRFEIATSAILATVLVSAVVLIGSPSYMAGLQQIVGA